MDSNTKCDCKTFWLLDDFRWRENNVHWLQNRKEITQRNQLFFCQADYIPVSIILNADDFYKD